MLYKSTIVLIILGVASLHTQVPKITVVIVVDQLSSHQFNKLLPYFTGGFRFLYDHGIDYSYALQAQGTPTTGPGHAALSTGTFAINHGIIANKWLNTQGKHIKCDKDPLTQEYAPTNLMVDTLSDQIIMNASTLFEVCALSLKSRSAIMMAGRLGKAWWFNKEGQSLVSSPFYYQSIPEWVQHFNTQLKTQNIYNYRWNPYYPLTSPAYQFIHPLSADKAIWPSLMHRTLHNLPFYKKLQLFQKTPAANEVLLEGAYQYIRNTLKNFPEKNIVVWLSLSSLDKVGHVFGAASFETIDILYQLDHQIGNFISKIEQFVPHSQMLFALTADHGVTPMLSLLQAEGYKAAKRIGTHSFVKGLNAFIKKNFNLKKLIIHYETPHIYLDERQLIKLSPFQKKQIFKKLKEHLLTTYKEIAQVWTFDELSTTFCPLGTASFFLQQQLYRGRSGHLIIQLRPYSQINIINLGAHHDAPYNYDMQVPLLICQKDILKPTTITQKVLIQQVAVTLSALLNVPRPSTSTLEPLPGLALKN
jgi:hypothetical protein